MLDKLKKGISGVIKKVKVKELSNKDLDPLVNDIKTLLMENEVAVQTADAIGVILKEQLINMQHSRFKDAQPLVEQALRNAVLQILTPPGTRKINLFELISEAKSEGRPYIICIMGINGTGKTTSIAKLAYLIQKQGYSVVFAASDTYRAGSIQQLGSHADKLGAKMIAQEYGSDPTSIAIDAIDHAESKSKDVVIIDTAGRMQNNVNLVRELEKIVRNTLPDLKIFVGDSLAGNDVIKQVEQFQKSIGIDGIIMTKLDSDVKGGAIISVAHTVGKPIMYVGVGQSYDDLIEFDPQIIINEVLP